MGAWPAFTFVFLHLIHFVRVLLRIPFIPSPGKALISIGTTVNSSTPMPCPALDAIPDRSKTCWCLGKMTHIVVGWLLVTVLIGVWPCRRGESGRGCWHGGLCTRSDPRVTWVLHLRWRLGFLRIVLFSSLPPGHHPRPVLVEFCLTSSS